MKKSDILLMLAIACIAATLRAPITAVGSLITLIRADIPLSNAVLGLLTTIPLILFAVVSPFVGNFDKRFGTGYVLLASLFVMIAGILLRSYFHIAGLFLGSVILGIGITFGNVLIPGIIKSRLQSHIGLATGLFITSLSAFAGISAGISLPISLLPGMNWRHGLAVWVILIIFAVVAWYPQRSIRLASRSSAGEDRPQTNLLKSPLAWWLTVFMAMQSIIFYFMVAWLPSVLNSRGISWENAGYYAFGYQIMSSIAAFLIPQLAARKADQRTILGITSSIYFFGIALLLVSHSPEVLLAASLICGFSSGTSFGMTMLLISLRSSDGAISAKLSGMVQSVGYAFAAIGPILMGSIFDSTNSWTLPLIILLSFTILLLLSGHYCGKNQTV
ncbi:MAG: hypothetical protein BGO78_13835 [Chloroflexi bacterium 44-23]|nr:MAG: hypothetical protein BGO78_13835 [Chloroflexi bacterium 44-23]